MSVNSYQIKLYPSKPFVVIYQTEKVSLHFHTFHIQIPFLSVYTRALDVGDPLRNTWSFHKDQYVSKRAQTNIHSASPWGLVNSTAIAQRDYKTLFWQNESPQCVYVIENCTTIIYKCAHFYQQQKLKSHSNFVVDNSVK